MKLVVGLGNPGKRYGKNRHNTGFLVLEKLKSRISNFQSPISNENEWKESKNAKAEYWSTKINGEVVELIRPQAMMNRSGYSVAYARNKHKVPNDNIYVIHDDLDIKLGEYKIQKGKGPREHKGLLSIYEKLGTRDFWHVRVGVDNDKSRIVSRGSRIHGEDYVLQNFTEDETKILNNMIDKVINEIKKKLIST